MASVNLINGGLDVQGIVDNLIAVERQPIQKLEQQAQSYQAKVTAYQAFNTKLLALKTSVDDLLFGDEDPPLSLPPEFADRFDTSLLALRKATSSDDSVVIPTAGKGQAVGNFTITVSNLATYHSIASGNLASDTETKTLTGTLIVQKGAEEAVTIAVDETNNTLQGIKNAINDADAGFTATILNDGSGSPYRLVITSNDSGTANALVITNNLTGGTGSAIVFGETTPAENAELQINGVSISSSSNQVTDAVEGVTFDLKAASGTAVVSVSRDLDAIVAGIQNFVSKYNDVVSYIGSQFRYDTAKKTAGILAGDFTLREAHVELGAVLFQSIDLGGNSIKVLAQAGLKLSGNGTLSLDEAKLRDMLSTRFHETAQLLLADGLDAEGNATSLMPLLQNRLKNLTDTVDGPLFHATDGVQQNIRRLNEQVAELEDRLEVRRQVLLAQYSKADEALRQLSVLQTSMESLMDSLSSL